MTTKIKLLRKPEYYANLKVAYTGDAGIDLCYAPERDVPLLLWHTQPRKVPTGIAVEIPEGYVGLVCPRSGLGGRGVIIPNAPGVVDSGYRGEISVLMVCPFVGETGLVTLRPGDRIAQLVVVPCSPQFEIVAELNENTERGVKGFGSSGR